MNQADIIIIGDGEQKSCCAEQQNLSEQIHCLTQGMILAYGEKITIKYLDLQQEKTNPLVEKAVKEGREFPLLFFNGEVKFEGGIPLLALKALLDRSGIELNEIRSQLPR